MELLTLVKQLSGPASAHAFDVQMSHPKGGAKRCTVFLFGDVHFSYDNTCPRCTVKGGCYDIVRFIESAQEHCAAKNVNLDVFLELPYVAKDRHGLDYIDAYFASNSSAAVRFRNSLAKFVGKAPKVIGMLSKLYTTFKDKIYMHRHRRDGGENANVRFHYADTRFEDHANLITPPLSPSPTDDKVVDWMFDFHARVESADKFCRILEAFTMSKSFAHDVRQLLGDEARIIDKSLSDVRVAGKVHRVHKVAKQFWNLPDDLRPVAEKYIRARIDYVRRFMIDVLNYDFHARQVQGLALKGVTSTRHELDMARSLVWTGLVAYIGHLAYPGIMLVCCMIIMDAYMVCRMLRFMFDPASKDGSCLVMYTGDAHTSHYVDFLVNYLGRLPKVRVSPLICSAMPTTQDDDTASATMRCVSLARPCDTQELTDMIHDKMYKTEPHSSA